MTDLITRMVVTNEQVAQELGLSHAMVSRIRSGDRLPSLDKMMLISIVYCWPLDEQASAKCGGVYAQEFETRLVVKHG